MRNFVAVGLLVSLFACSAQEELAPFASDGCSLFPDQDLITQADWCACCTLHDAAYWRGGTRVQRSQADQALHDCVLEKTDDQALATLMYEGVRVGGSPYFYNWYRWGYGWSFQRKYKSLSEAEWRQVERRWNEFHGSRSGLSCPDAPPPYDQLRSTVFGRE